jgi:uncharacterized protein YigA (DUF484 family)
MRTKRSAHAAASERLRARLDSTLATIGQLREHSGTLQNAVDTLDKERNREGQSLRLYEDSSKVAIRRASVDSARAAEIRRELEKYRSEAHSRPGERQSTWTRQRKTVDSVGEP